MRDIRRKEKAIADKNELIAILQKAKYITIAMCKDNEPYLVSLSHGYDPMKNSLYFHCAGEGKKIDILKENSVVWGQALIDKGYVQGKCDHLYVTVQFRGKVTFLEDFNEKKDALLNMIHKLDENPNLVISEQITEKSVKRVTIGRIDIDFLSGKQANRTIISL